MKKISKLLFIFIFTLIFVPNVYAFKMGESFTISNDHNSHDSGLGFPSNMGYSISKATQSSTGKSFEAFCIDRGNSPNGSNFVVGRLLPSSTSSTVAKYDYAALYIMNNSNQYNVKHYALRILTDVIQPGFENSNDPAFVSQEGALVKEFLKDEEFSKAYNAYGGAKVTTTATYAGNASAASPVKEILTKALNYAAEYSKDNKATKVEKGEEGQVNKVTENGQVTYTKIVSIKLDINNITGTSTDEYFKLTKEPEIIAKNGATVKFLGVSKTFNDSEEGWDPVSSNEDLSQKLSDSDRKGTLYLGFSLTLTKEDKYDDADEEDSEEDCSVSIKIEYEYTSAFSGARISPKGETSKDSKIQRFLVSSTEPVNGDFTLNTQLCSDTKCQPTVTIPTICEPGDSDNLVKYDENDIEEYLDYEFREAYNPDTKTYNIKKCLLKKDSKDIAENSYKYVDATNAQAVQDNPYCEVRCKEDYKFGVPYKKTAEAGRYFQISVKIKGQQDCYTTKIDKDQYSKDVVEKQKEIVDAYNEWLYYYENLTFVDKTETWIKDTSQEIKCSEDEGADVEYKYYINHSNKFIKYTVEDDGKKITFSKGNPSDVFSDTNMGNKSYFGKEDSSKDPMCISAKSDWESQKSGFEEKRNAAKAKITKAIEELKEIVDKYNSCGDDKDYTSVSGDTTKKLNWDMVYVYDPYVKYSYQEPEPGNNSVSKWINEVQGLSCEKGTCDIMISPDEKVQAEVCASGSANCEQATQVEDIDGNIHDTTWRCDGEVNNAYDTCDGSTEISYDKEHYFVCDVPESDEGEITCSNTSNDSEFSVTKIKYVHKIASSIGTYNTARVYFSGHDDGNIKIANQTEMENYDRVDGLPVGINTAKGVYYYILTLDNIGTFYSTSPTLGRIFGTSSDSMSNYYIDKGIRKSETTTTNDNSGITLDGNQYACTYEVSQSECVDSSGKSHYKTECNKDEDWDTCKERLCPASSEARYCVMESKGYYVCDNNYFDSTCQKMNSRQEALAAVGCTPGEQCERNYNCCPNCVVECIDCVVTREDPNTPSKPSYDFRPVSPGNLFPTDRVVGFNWETNANVYGNKLVARKAGDTRTEITKRATGETGQGSGGSSGVPTVEKYTLKVTMNTDMITKIREYNKEQGTYNNDTLKCEDYVLTGYDENRCKKNGYSFNDTDKTCRMSNIFCYSTFVDKLLNDDFGGKVEMANKDGRTKNKENFSTIYTGPAGTMSDVVTNDYWTIYKFSSLDTNGDGIPDVGPSWK